jgi:hypothetical protein
MNKLRHLVAVVFAGLCFLSFSARTSAAQVSFGIQIGPEPVCPYGYFEYAPYQCAPYGYYGPEWFTNGVFIGSGPWYHGHEHFRGHVDNRYDPHYGYHGHMPNHGDRPDWDHHHGTVENFRGHDSREAHPRDDHDHDHR